MLKVVLSAGFVIFLSVMYLVSCSPDKGIDVQEQKRQVTRRVGQVIEIKPEKIQEYKALHADSNPGVRDLLSKANIENFSIFIKQFDDGKYYLFAYYEYTGDDYHADMKKLAEKERNIRWLETCDPMQVPFEGEESWSVMDQIYYNR